MSIMPETDRTDKIDRADEFLDKYRQLEEALRNKYGGDEKNYGSPIVRFLSEKESKPYRDRLNVCREIRNFLTHHAEFDGERVIQPSNSLIRFLDEVTALVKSPPSALKFATLYEDILKTSLSQKAQTVMKKMQRQGFSHVPVMEGGECIGVFSVSTIFSYSLEHGLATVRDDMVIAEFAEMLNFDKHSAERFRFVGRDASIYEVRNEFERKSRTSKRLAAVFITDNGSSRGRILGMLTPWDVIDSD